MTGQTEVQCIAGALLVVALAVSLWALRLELTRPTGKTVGRPERPAAELQTTVAGIQARLRQEQRAAALAAARAEAAATRGARRSLRRPAANPRPREKKRLSP
ncbi:hypothetical protein PV458_29300 [Streptomyces sp. MN03-5084-2B]|nr:hypothetical protein [Streptomyces sp. MN03-5084-2B]